ncbi:MAG: SET domain-containing protein [Chitinophagales bacterium]|nr:SET domain-containing protein [Bacteroidota bacterium]MCB9043173.1 SET domain-containing protein [Chitinophagales bacterium]
MIHPKTCLKYINNEVGYGVFATEFIPRGTITYVKDALEIEISPKDYQQHTTEMQAVIEKYSYIDEKGYRILSWDFSKYINHCCNCNSMSTGYGFEIAIRDIFPGEEITDEYGIFNLVESIPLQCNQQNCRKYVHPNDFDALYAQWDKWLVNALACFQQVEQPLLPLMDAPTQSELSNYLNQQAAYKSVYALRFKKQEVSN